jgi:hypothetical protein
MVRSKCRVNDLNEEVSAQSIILIQLSSNHYVYYRPISQLTYPLQNFTTNRACTRYPQINDRLPLLFRFPRNLPRFNLSWAWHSAPLVAPLSEIYSRRTVSLRPVRHCYISGCA